MYQSETVIKDLGNNLYAISCYPTFAFMFEVIEYAPVGTIVQAGYEIANCTTQDLSFSLCIDFTAKIVEVNQPLIDYTRANKGENIIYSGFAQTDWICKVAAVEYFDSSNIMFSGKPDYFEPTTWHKFSNSINIEVGFSIYDLPADIFFRNFNLLGDTFFKGDKLCSFEYYPNYHYLTTQNKWQVIEHKKKIGYLYAPCDIVQMPIFNPLLLAKAQYNPNPNNWILIDSKQDFILSIQPKVIFYIYGFLWYSWEGENIRVGLNADDMEYLNVHKPYFPMQYAKPKDILYTNANNIYLCEIAINGPMDLSISVDFDLEVLEVNTKVWRDLGEANDLLTNEYLGAGWLFVVKPLDLENTKKLFSQWQHKQYFI